MSSEFLFFRRTSPFGPLSYPTIPVTVRTQAGDRAFDFLIDTGADISLASRHVARQVGLDWETLPETAVMGIEQGRIEGKLGRLPIHLDGVDVALRCVFVDTPPANAPFILGRTDFLDRFVLTLDATRGRITITAIP